MNQNYLTLTLCLLASKLLLTHQHGYLSDPPSRASAWLVDKDFVECCQNYNYNQMFCGGRDKQWGLNGQTGNDGKCGICGDSWDEPKEYEKNGTKYLGKILRNYAPNSRLPVTVQITANHEGFFEFRICNVDGWADDASQECLNKTLLTIEGTQNSKYKVETLMRTVQYNLNIPPGFVCNHCVLQWKYVTGNSWGTDPETQKSCVGCGPVQENFVGCADISIRDLNLPELSTTTSTKKMIITTKSQIKDETTSNNSLPISSTTKGPDTTSKTSVLYKECTSKLKYGTMEDLTESVNKYCSRICGMRCGPMLLDMEMQTQINGVSFLENHNYIACTQTCPLICSCD